MVSVSLQRCLSLIVGCLSMTVGGMYLLAAIFLVDLKAQFHLTQLAAELVVGIGVAAGNLAYPWGVLLERISLRTAYMVSMAIGCSGAMLLYSADKSPTFYRKHWPLLAVYWGCVCTSCVLDHLIAVAVNLGNFPRQRQGIVMGLLGCCLWLGQSFLLYLYTEIHSNSPGSLGLIFLVLGVWMFVIKGLGAVFVHPIPLEDDEAIPIIQCETTPQEEIQQPRVASESMSGEPIGNDKSHSRSQYFDLEVLRQTDFQLLLWGFVLGVATQYIFIGNLSIMATSLGLDSLYSLVAILSPIVTMMLSLLCGWLSDMTLELFPRATYLSVASLLQVLAYATAVVVGATRWAFTATTFLMYINNGLFFAMGGSLLAERFGSRYFKRHWGMIMMLAAAMAFIMLLIVGKLYQEACPTVPLTTPEGLQCFWGVYILGAFASAVSTYCFVMLQRHTIMAECRWLLNPSSGH